jgi:hypothetical protein
MFGYSSDDPLYWYDAYVNNGSSTKRVNETNWIQSTIYFYDGSSYKFTPGHDNYLRKDRGYWIYAFEDNLTLMLPGVGGSLSSNSRTWQDVEVVNGSDKLNILEAQSSGWLQGTIYYFDENLQHYKLVPGDDPYIYSWRGYWLYSNRDDLQLIII